MKCILLFFLVVLGFLMVNVNTKTCSEDDLAYAFTECHNNMRWRVQVPRTDCTGDSVSFPTMGLPCNFTCQPGSYLDIGKSECRPCPIGEYSLGSGIRYDTFQSLPKDLKVFVEPLGEQVAGVCSRSGWLPMGEFLAGKPDPRCLAKLMLTVNLATEGSVTFRYQYRRSDALFMFDVQNDRCESVSENGPGPWMEQTEQGEIGIRRANLSMGMNVIRWTLVTPAAAPGVAGGRSDYPALINSIEVTGLPFVYSCQPCRPGWQSLLQGQAACTPCPRDQFSVEGGAACRPCPEELFASPGSGECRPRPPCRLSEPWQEACPAGDVPEATTQLKYRWVQPQVCRELPGGATLPSSGASEPCSKPANPCYPGAEFVPPAAGRPPACRPCPAGQYSPDAAGVCRPCPANTQPRRELSVTNWLLGPANVARGFLATECTTSSADSEIGCPSGGWAWSRVCLRTAAARAFSARVLVVNVAKGFVSAMSDLFARGGTAPSAGGHAGHLRIEFEMACAEPCQLALYENSTLRGTRLRKQWINSQDRQNVTVHIDVPDPVTFQLVFENTVSIDPNEREKAAGDHLKVFVIQVTNANLSGAVECTPCPMGLNNDKCIPCMPGHYYSEPGGSEAPGNATSSANQTSAGVSGRKSAAAKGEAGCLPCPVGTRVSRHPAIGLDSCTPCPGGLVPLPGGMSCGLDPRPVDPEGRTVNLAPILSGKGSQATTVQSGRMFALSGAQYSHLYNLSMAGRAVCEANATKISGQGQIKVRVSQSYLCRSTLVPGNKRGTSRPSLLLPTSLADHLLNASQVPRRQTDARLRAEGFADVLEAGAAFPDGPRYDLEVWLASSDSAATEACPAGRLTRITVRCDPLAPEQDRLLLPPACPDGTCDGCEFRFLLLGRSGCPLCRKQDYDIVRGECLLGRQTVHLYPPKYCFELDGSHPEKRTETASCSIVSGPVFVLLCALLALGVFCTLIACYCCKKNRSLQYKYSQLIESTEGGEPIGGPESCAVHEGDEPEGPEDAPTGTTSRPAPQRRKGDRAMLLSGIGDMDL